MSVTSTPSKNALILADYIVGHRRALADLIQTAEGLSLAPSKLRQDIRRGLLQPTRLGRRLAFSREQIATYIDALGGAR